MLTADQIAAALKAARPIMFGPRLEIGGPLSRMPRTYVMRIPRTCILVAILALKSVEFALFAFAFNSDQSHFAFAFRAVD